MTETAERALTPGARIRIFQRIDRREGAWDHVIEGTVAEVYPEKQGSWYAHGKNDKLWLVRVRIRKEDGELSTVTVDQNTRYELLPA